jgi:hypothetical protein
MRKFKIGETLKIVRFGKLLKLGNKIIVFRVEDYNCLKSNCVNKDMFEICNKQTVNGYCGFRFEDCREEKLKRILKK